MAGNSLLKQHQEGRLEAKALIREMARIYRHRDYHDQILAPWYWLDEEVSSFVTGYYYPGLTESNVQEIVQREIHLYAAACAETLSNEEWQLSWGASCNQLVKPNYRSKFSLRNLLTKLFSKTRLPLWPFCPHCNGDQILSLISPEVREALFRGKAAKRTHHQDSCPRE